MFCLRSWIPILFFLTNTSPVYLLLFITATYFLNRPCVYCSILLAVLVLSLFDFHSNWFEARHSSAALLNTTSEEPQPGYNATLETASIIAASINDTAQTLITAAAENVKARVTGQAQPYWSVFGLEWLKSLAGKKEWRIHCVDVVIRL